MRTIDGLLSKIPGVRPYLDVPFFSQLNTYAYADDHNNDCGPACVSMIAGAFGVGVTPDGVYDYLGLSGDPYTSTWNLISVLKVLGIESDRTVGRDIIELVNDGKGIIILVDYSKFPPNKHSSFIGQHWIVVVGYLRLFGKITHILVNDPLTPEENHRPRIIPATKLYRGWDGGEVIRLAIVTEESIGRG